MNHPTSLKRTDFMYDLPAELIAQKPMEPRDASKLLVLDRSGNTISHSEFRVLPSFLRAGDILVRNNSKVIKARLFGYKYPTNGRVEILLNKHVSDAINQTTWECICRPGLSVGQEVRFGTENCTAVCVGLGADGYTRLLEFRVSRTEFLNFLEEHGETPLPPYITPQSSATVVEKGYQTTYAQTPGSVAAPTAGLHFTKAVDAALEAAGVTIAEVTLHVGLGTFLPVKSNQISDHHMHAEHYSLSESVAELLTTAKENGRRIIAVGTTTCRVLESAATTAADGSVLLTARSAETDIFIYPPHKFLCVDGLITNFHLPESTLLMLISAFVSAPNTTYKFRDFLSSPVGVAYTQAIAHNYRFFSFGDAMLII